MGMPRAPEAKLYYRAAKQRLAEAEVLLNAGMKVGAVYLAGYTVECFLKALILQTAARGLRPRLFREFRGQRAHDIEWLVGSYRRHTGAHIPREVIPYLARVATWDTDLRYATRARDQGDADDFMKCVRAIASWADGRM